MCGSCGKGAAASFKSFRQSASPAKMKPGTGYSSFRGQPPRVKPLPVIEDPELEAAVPETPEEEPIEKVE